MIIHDLIDHYDRLVSNNKSLPKDGWSDQTGANIIIVFNASGDISNVEVYQEKEKIKSFVPCRLICGSRGNKIEPNFLYDTCVYVFGETFKETYKNNTNIKRELRHKLFIEKHKKYLSNINDPTVNAFLNFLSKREKDKRKLQFTNSAEILSQYINEEDIHYFCNKNPNPYIFLKLKGDDSLIHQTSIMKKTWQKIMHEWSPVDTEKEETQSYVSGKLCNPILLHPSIKGIRGSSPTGDPIISYNQETAQPYGCQTCPMSELEVFKYSSALKYLLNSDHNRCFLGNKTTAITFVYWCENAIADKLNIWKQVISKDQNISDNVRIMMEEGQLPKGIDENANYYIYGLVGKQGRSSLVFSHIGQINKLINNLQLHKNDMGLNGEDPPTLSDIKFLLSKKLFGSRNFPQQILLNFINSIINGTPYRQDIKMVAKTIIQNNVEILKNKEDKYFSKILYSIIKGFNNRQKRLYKKGGDEKMDRYSQSLGELLVLMEKLANITKSGGPAFWDRNIRPALEGKLHCLKYFGITLFPYYISRIHKEGTKNYFRREFSKHISELSPLIESGEIMKNPSLIWVSYWKARWESEKETRSKFQKNKDDEKKEVLNNK